MNFIIIHGTYGDPGEHWFPWLKKGLEELGHKVIVPKFPSAEDHSLMNWMNVLNNYNEIFNKQLILVGHSIGVAFILRKLEEINDPIKASFLVAGFVGVLGNKYDGVNKTFFENDFNWDKIRSNCERFYVYHSDNDPYVPLEKGESLARKLNAKLKIVESAGHFSKTAGYTKFDLLLKDIKKEVEE